MERKYKVVIKVGDKIVFEDWVKANEEYTKELFEKIIRNRMEELIREFNRR